MGDKKKRAMGLIPTEREKKLMELSETERKAYNFIKEAKQPLPIRDMSHQLQGAVGKLTSKGLVERYRTQAQVAKHGFTSMKMTNCVRVKE